MARKLKKKQKPVTIEITELDGKKKRIGKYDPEKNTFYADRIKSEHLMRKWNAWGLDSKVVEFLVEKKAKVHIKDKETHWEYECSAVDLKTKGKYAEINQHRPQYFLNVGEWEVTKAKGRSYILECGEVDCAFNFTNTCIRGVIKLGREGNCESYQDRQP